MNQVSSTLPDVGAFGSDTLSEEQQDKLVGLLDRYLISLETGVPLSLESLIEDAPELADSLRSYVAGLEDLHDVAVGFASGEHSDLEIAENPNGRILGDFELVQEIGRGGMGVVYKARQISLDRIVALKLLPFASTLDSKQIARFKNEAHAAAQLHHPNIIPVFAVGEQKGVHFFAMRFIDGTPIDELIARQKESKVVLDVDRCVSIAIDAAKALDAAHEFGVVHRDIKPSNLILDHEGKIWVSDFGLAQCPTDVSLTQTGDVVGTARYMSPEQARGGSSLMDGRTDLYSLAATLYEMLCLEPAISGDNPAAVLRNLDSNSIVPLRQLRSDLPQDLVTVIDKAMSWARDGRYETAGEFAADLQRVLDGKPTVARPPTLVDRITLWANRHRHFVVGFSAFVLVAFFGLAISTALVTSAMRRSEANFKLAERNQVLWRGAVDKLGTQVAELLAKVPEAKQVRRHLLAETLESYKQFADEAGDNPELTLDLAMTNAKIGELLGELGALEESIEALESSHTLLSQLSDADPDNKSLLRYCANSKNNLALALQSSGQLRRAETLYREAIDLQTHGSQHGDSIALAELSLSHNNLGLLLGQQENVDEAAQAYEHSIRLLESLQPASRTSDMSLQLAGTYDNLSGLLLSSDARRSAEYSSRSLSLQTELLASDRGQSDIASQTANTLNGLAAAQVRLGGIDQAIESYQQAIDILQQLRLRSPRHNPYLRDLAVTQNNLGLAFAKLNQLEASRDSFLSALSVQSPLAKTFSSDANVLSTLGGIFNNLGYIEERLESDDDALTAYAKAIEYQQQAVEAGPEVPKYHLFLSNHCVNYARLLRQSGKTDQATQVTLMRRALCKNDGKRLFAVAEDLAQTHGLIQSRLDSQSDDPLFSENDCLDLTRETLRMASEAGYRVPDDLSRHPKFASMQDKLRSPTATQIPASK